MAATGCPGSPSLRSPGSLRPPSSQSPRRPPRVGRVVSTRSYVERRRPPRPTPPRSQRGSSLRPTSALSAATSSLSSRSLSTRWRPPRPTPPRSRRGSSDSRRPTSSTDTVGGDLGPLGRQRLGRRRRLDGDRAVDVGERHPKVAVVRIGFHPSPGGSAHPASGSVIVAVTVTGSPGPQVLRVRVRPDTFGLDRLDRRRRRLAVDTLRLDDLGCRQLDLRARWGRRKGDGERRLRRAHPRPASRKIHRRWRSLRARVNGTPTGKAGRGGGRPFQARVPVQDVAITTTFRSRRRGRTARAGSTEIDETRRRLRLHRRSRGHTVRTQAHDHRRINGQHGRTRHVVERVGVRRGRVRCRRPTRRQLIGPRHPGGPPSVAVTTIVCPGA